MILFVLDQVLTVLLLSLPLNASYHFDRRSIFHINTSLFSHLDNIKYHNHPLLTSNIFTDDSHGLMPAPYERVRCYIKSHQTRFRTNLKDDSDPAWLSHTT
jgi:hypothetical protein